MQIEPRIRTYLRGVAKNLKQRWLPAFWKKKIPNTQEIKRTLFNWTKQDETCKFSRKSSFSSYVQYNRKLLNQLIMCQFHARSMLVISQQLGYSLYVFSFYPSRKPPGVLLIYYVFWIFFKSFFQNAGSQLCFRFLKINFFVHRGLDFVGRWATSIPPTRLTDQQLRLGQDLAISGTVSPNNRLRIKCD